MSEPFGMPESLTIGNYRELTGLKLAELAEKLDCSKGHVSDLCSGKQPVSQRIARQMEAISGIPWYRWMENSTTGEGA